MDNCPYGITAWAHFCQFIAAPPANKMCTLGLILDSSQSKRQKTTLEMLSVHRFIILAGFVFPQVNEYLKAPFDSVKTTVIEAILSKGTKHQDPSWLSGALRNLYILYGTSS